MTLQSKSFIVSKGDTLENITRFLEKEIGLNAYLIKSVKAVALNSTKTQITLLFERYNSNIVESIAPREGAIFGTGITSDEFDLRFLFNDPIDYRSIQSGTFKIDGISLDTDRISLDTGSNGYFLKVLASGSSFQSEDFHTYQLSTTDLKRRDGSSINYGPIGGYVFHTLSNAHIGDYIAPYIGRRRGKLGMAVVRLSKGINPQQAITEFLSQRRISDDRLISYTPVSVGTNLSDIYFIYISKLEPQIISGFPLNNSLLPDVAAPSKVTFVFNTKLDKARLASTDGLFSIESDYFTSTLVPASKITLLDDLHTVEIDVSTYFTAQKIYSVIARPGILGLDGLSKQKPEQWTIHISAYEPGAGGSGEGDVTQAEYNYLSGLFSGHTGVTTIHYPQGDISISTGQLTNLPPLVTVAEYTSFSGQFTGHTGEPTFHFTQAEISITEEQISDLGTYATTGNLGYLSGKFIGHTGSISNPHTVTATQVGAPTILEFTGLSGLFLGHTGESPDIHYTQANITIAESQISDLGTYATTGNLGYLSGLFSGHTGEPSIHFTTGAISHLYIGDIGTSSHATIDSHLGNTSNPHIVTAVDVGSPTLANYSFLSGVFTGLNSEFTGHSGQTDIHFVHSSISLPVSQVNSESATNGYVITANGAGAALWADPTGFLSPTLAGLDATAPLDGIDSGNIIYTTGVNIWGESPISAFMLTVLDDANQGTALGTLGAQPLHAGLTSIAGASMSANQILIGSGTDAYTKISMSSFIQGLIDDADASTARTTLGAQASDADLTALAAVTIAADEFLYGDGDASWAKATLTAFGRSLIDDASASAARTTLGLGAVALLASIANANMASMSAATVKGSVGGGTPADLTMAQLQSIAKVKLRTPFHSDGGEACQLGAHPQTEQFLKNLNINIQIADLSTYSQVRMFCRIYTTSASSRSPRLIAKYHTSYTTTLATYSDIGTSEVSCSMAAYTLVNSGWIDLADGAMIDDCYITVTQIGGDSSATPRISSLFMEFR